MVRALLLADKTDLSDEIQDDFRACGIAHLLALSGLHLAVLAGAVHFLLSRLRLPHKLCFAVTMAILAAYAVLVGSPASVLRAMLLYGFLALAHITSPGVQREKTINRMPINRNKVESNCHILILL